jgi:hypothetical protein
MKCNEMKWNEMFQEMKKHTRQNSNLESYALSAYTLSIWPQILTILPIISNLTLWIIGLVFFIHWLNKWLFDNILFFSFDGYRSSQFFLSSDVEFDSFHNLSLILLLKHCDGYRGNFKFLKFNELSIKKSTYRW